MKNNKVSFFYIASSVLLFVTLLAGGLYGVYVSIGLKFMRSNIENIAGDVAGSISNVSYGGTVNFSPNMTGVIILSIILVVLSVFDFIALMKQIVFFKQFKIVKESCLEKKIESKVKSKSSVIIFVCLIDILSIVAGVVGFFVNVRNVNGGSGVSWVLYLIDALVTIFALISLVLLFVKIKQIKKFKKEQFKNEQYSGHVKKEIVEKDKILDINDFNVDKFEYILLKIKHLKSSRIITDEEYKIIREKLIGIVKKVQEKITTEKIEENKNKACD